MASTASPRLGTASTGTSRSGIRMTTGRESDSPHGSSVSLEPADTLPGATGAVDLIEHDPIRSFDLRGFWLDSALVTRSSYGTTFFALMPWSAQRFVSRLDCGTSVMQRRARDLVSRTGYEVCMLLLILANAVFLGWQVEYEAHTRSKLPMTIEVEAFFCTVFTVELAIKMYAMGCLFWTGSDASWNYFDVFVVVLMVLDLSNSLAYQDVPSEWSQVSGLRIFRVLRVVRLLRSIKQLRFFQQLRIMVRSLLVSLRPLLWASVVFAGMFYVFGLWFTQGVTDHLRRHDLWEDGSSADLRHYFGTLHRCALSLFKAMSGGLNWGILFDVLSPLDLHFRLMFLFFVLFAIFGASNVVTGIFVEIASQWARSDSSLLEHVASEKRADVLKRLCDVFEDLDTSRDGTVTLEGMQDAFANKSLVSSFHALDLEVTDVRTLFLLLDRDRKGYINLNDFLLGCFRLAGGAKTLDTMKLQYQCEWMMHSMSKILDKLDRAGEPQTGRSQHRPGGRRASGSTGEPGDARPVVAGQQLPRVVASQQLPCLLLGGRSPACAAGRRSSRCSGDSVGSCATSE